jgi:replicative DNA helicase
MSELDTLVKFGAPFQRKCIVSLLTDRGFVEQSIDVCKKEFFESEAHQWIINRIFWYFGQYRALPTMEVFKKEVDKLTVDTLRAGVIEQLGLIYKQDAQSADDLRYVKDEFLAFCKNQSLKSAILKSVDLLQTGQYDQIKSTIDLAMRAGQERNLGHIYLEELEIRVNKIARNTIATPWPCINEILDGGLGSGELGCIVAPSGIGKSWILAAIGAHAMTLGKTVAHYTLELSETYMGLRYDSIFTGIEPNEIKNNTRSVQEAMEGISGKLFIKYFPTRSITTNTLHAHIQRLQNLDNAPDLILIDYADLMRCSGKAEARHEELGFIHEELRGMLGELKLPGWTASQSQRSSIQDDIVEADKIAGSYAKIMTDDFVMSLSRKLADKITNTARAHAIKNRFGPDGMTFPAHMDLQHGQIKIYDEKSQEGVAIKQKLQSGVGTAKSIIAKRLMDPARSEESTVSALDTRDVMREIMRNAGVGIGED